MFRRLDYPLWRTTAHNPVRMLRLITPRAPRPARATTRRSSRCTTRPSRGSTMRAAREADVVERRRVGGAADAARSRTSRPSSRCTSRCRSTRAASGVLAGDHCKEASDLGLPLVGVGFMYPAGLLPPAASRPTAGRRRSTSGSTGRDAPIEPAVTPDGKPCIIAVPLGNRTVLVAVWRVRLGRAKLYLLDTDLEENAPWDRELSARLYGGDRETRSSRRSSSASAACARCARSASSPPSGTSTRATRPSSCCSASASSLEQGLSFDDALEEVRRTTVFTTHTPVPAGHDAFPFHLVETHLAGCWGSLGDYREQLPRARRARQRAAGTLFNMTALAHAHVRRASTRVSELHGEVTRDMWAPIWPETPSSSVPVDVGHQRRAPATWMATRAVAGCSTAPRRRLARATRRPGDVGRRSSTSRTRSSGRTRSAARATCSRFIRERVRQRWTDERVGPAAGRRRRARCSTPTR